MHRALYVGHRDRAHGALRSLLALSITLFYKAMERCEDFGIFGNTSSHPICRADKLLKFICFLGRAHCKQGFK